MQGGSRSSALPPCLSPRVPAAPRSGQKEALGSLCQGAVAGPEAVLAYLSRYTHRVAILNSRLIGFSESGVTFRYKDYRRAGTDRQQVMTLGVDEFIRRFLLHILPKGFHLSGITACSPGRSARSASRWPGRCSWSHHHLVPDELEEPPDPRPPCPCCDGRMIVVETVPLVAAARIQRCGAPCSKSLLGRASLTPRLGRFLRHSLRIMRKRCSPLQTHWPAKTRAPLAGIFCYGPARSRYQRAKFRQAIQ